MDAGYGSIFLEVRGGALMALLGPGDRVPRDATDNGSPTVGLPYMSKFGKRKVSSPAAWQGEARYGITPPLLSRMMEL